jgi:dipeptidyl-peptidase-4
MQHHVTIVQSARRLLLAAVLALPIATKAQTSAYTLKAAMLNGARNYPINLQQLNWLPGTHQFAYVKESDGDYRLLVGEVGKVDRSTILSLKEFNTSVKAAGLNELPRFPIMTYTGAKTFRFNAESARYQYDCATKSLTKLVAWDADAANLDITEQGHVAYTKGPNLYISLPGRENVAVTQEAGTGIRNGEAVHRFEFGIDKGTFWSPDGKQLAYYRMDESMVTDYPILDLNAFPAKADNVKYPFAGAKSHQVTVGIYHTATGQTTFLETGGDPEHYLTNVTWSADGKEVWIAELNRDQNQMSLNRYDAATGKRISNVIEEADAKYVEPKHGPIWLPATPGEFLWLSQRDGYKHLYHYRLDGTLIGQLTKGEWLITNFLGFDAKGKTAYIETTQLNATERHAYALDLKSKALTLLTPGKGTHTATLHPSGSHLLDHWTAVEVPRILRVMDAKGKAVQELLKADDPLKDYSLPQAQLAKIKAADGKTELWTRTFLPSNFDPAKKYPVLIYVYNGPSVQLITDTYLAAAPTWMPWFATQGYIVFTVDGRGSTNRGRDFEQASFRHLGDVELEDQMAGVAYLKSLPYVDAKRLAVHGWSYGGFMTCTMLTRTDDAFRVGVAGGPVIDWSMYEVMYTERYMDTPETNPDGYKQANVMNHISDLKSDLLVIHGTSDDVVVWQQSLELIEAAVSKGVQLDYFMYPNHPHNVLGPDRLHLMEKVLDYIVAHNQ